MNSLLEDAREARRIIQIVTDSTRENLNMSYIRAFMSGLRKAGISMEQYEELKKKSYLERNLSI